MNLKSVNQLADIIRGVSYSPSDVSGTEKDGYLPLLRAMNIDNGSLKYDDLVYVNQKRINISQKVQKGDVVIAASTGSKKVIGKAAQSKKDWNGSFGVFCMVLRPKDEVDPDYFGYFFQSDYYRKMISHMSSGANINNLKREYFDRLFIPVLSPEEQKQIANELNNVNALRAKRKLVIRMMDDYLQTVFYKMFGDPVENQNKLEIIKFGEIVEDIRYGSSRKSTNEASDKIVPILRIPNILHGKINYNDLQYQDLPSNEKQKLLLKKGDILFVRSNGNPDYIGRCAVFHDIDDCIYASYLIRVRLKYNSEFRPDFVRYVFSVDSYKQKIRKESRTTAGNYNINTQGIKNFDLIKPSLILQDKFLTLFNEVEALKEKMNDQAKELDNQFQALMQSYFNQN